ncbi:hypothetical protein FPQ18DRAFT_302563 [Pyronema domesticum]|uniref:Uncharacterized protein n=1 Tax=Pyronema omphalodes (strain CBS 100304) TaxID=1076935 RepID=U4KXT9_PYROM|nr:hypothetical protein FPQ18DRAFT_302563 [Pyronema domesticum]CCX06666.1 Similar to hypothetical protein [Tuber melanosporum Mel28]; acc. no. XP_002839185 [Pyronema omphalodes CBS 100304]
MVRVGSSSRNSSESPSQQELERIYNIRRQLDDNISHAFDDFHAHSKICHICREPIRRYQAHEDLCDVGIILTQHISTLLYKKAEHCPDGKFSVTYPAGYHAVDQVVRMIAHYHHGEYDLNIMDIRRFPIGPVVDSDHNKGSEYDADRERRQLQRERRSGASLDPSPRSSMRSDNSRSPRSSHSPRSSGGDWGNPHTSFMDLPTGQTQAGASPVSSNASVDSRRSVHFKPTVHVREFSNDH